MRSKSTHSSRSVNRHYTSWQFVKDGLVGLGVIVVIYVLLLGVIVSMTMPALLSPSGASSTFSAQLSILFSFLFQLFPLGGNFVNPIPYVLLIAFIGSGVCARFVEQISTRGGWVKPMVIVNLISWLAGGLLLTLLFFLTFIFLNGIASQFDVNSFFGVFFQVARAVLLWGLFGAVAGWIVGCAAGAIFNPQQRIYKILILSISFAFASIANGFGLIFIQGMS